MVIEYEVKDLESFVSRLACTEELLSENSVFEPLLYKPCGFITKRQAKLAYEANKKHDDKVRRKHKLLEKIVTLSTHMAKDVLFETMIDLMTIMKKDHLRSEDFALVRENVETVYNKYNLIQATKKANEVVDF